MQRQVIVFFLVISICIINGCATFNESALKIEEEYNCQLPPLEITFDEDSFLNGLGYLYTTDISSVSKKVGEEGWTIQNRKYFISDHWDKQKFVITEIKKSRIGENAKRIINREIRNNLFANKSAFSSDRKDTIGTVKVRMLSRRKIRAISSAIYFTLPSALSCFTLNFLGYPFWSNKVTVDFEFTIEKINGEKVWEKQIKGSGTAYSAFYWGYSIMSNKRTKYPFDLLSYAIDFAVLDAVENFLVAVEDDQKEINKALSD